MSTTNTAKALERWQDTTKETLGIQDEIAERSQRIDKARREVLLPLQTKQQQLTASKQKLARLEADAWNSGKPEDSPAIRTARAEVRTLQIDVEALESRAVYIRIAVKDLEAEITERQRILELIQSTMPRQILAAIDGMLAEHADRQAQAMRAYQAAQTELAALAIARNTISPKVPGSNALYLQDLTQLHLPLPTTHPAYAGVPNLINLWDAAQKRAKDILADLGVRA